MKKTNKGFTLVELIIVIAVIGVLAAILIPVFANVIEKANAKSAYSDARNAVSIFVSQKSDGNGGAVIGNNSEVWVLKNGNQYFKFTYVQNGLKPADNTGDHVYYNALGTAPANATTYTASSSDLANLPAGVTMYVVD